MDNRSRSQFRLSDYLKILQGRLCPAIVGEYYLERLYRLTDNLPGEISTFFGLECPMASGRKDADFLFCSTQQERHTAIIAGSHPVVQLPDNLVESDPWETVVKFCQAWESEKSDLNGGIHNLWLEFDVGGSDGPWDPSLFFGLEYDHNPTVNEVLEVTKRALHFLDRDALSGPRLKTLERVFNKVPDNTRIFQVGVMLARRSSACRICIRGIPPAHLAGFLADVGYQGNLDELSAFIDNTNGFFDSVALDLDIGDEIGDKVGLEFSFDLNDDALSRIEGFLSHCVDLGLTDLETMQSLLDFHFVTHSGEESGLWPEKLLKQAALFGVGSIGFIACWLHHVKIDFHPNKPINAKAYLAMEAGRTKVQDFVSAARRA
jgi:hypothetical protein